MLLAVLFWGFGHGIIARGVAIRPILTAALHVAQRLVGRDKILGTFTCLRRISINVPVSTGAFTFF